MQHTRGFWWYALSHFLFINQIKTCTAIHRTYTQFNVVYNATWKFIFNERTERVRYLMGRTENGSVYKKVGYYCCIPATANLLYCVCVKKPWLMTYLSILDRSKPYKSWVSSSNTWRLHPRLLDAWILFKNSRFVSQVRQQTRVKVTTPLEANLSLSAFFLAAMNFPKPHTKTHPPWLMKCKRHLVIITLERVLLL